LISSIQGRSSKAATATWRRLTFGQRRDPIFWLIASGCILVAAICVGTMIMIGEFRERALKNGERELENTVMLLTRHFEQQFEDSEAIAAELSGR